jgi:hypothetical protein
MLQPEQLQEQQFAIAAAAVLERCSVDPQSAILEVLGASKEPVVDGLTQYYIFKQKLLNCAPIDLSQQITMHHCKL